MTAPTIQPGTRCGAILPGNQKNCPELAVRMVPFQVGNEPRGRYRPMCEPCAALAEGRVAR